MVIQGEKEKNEEEEEKTIRKSCSIKVVLAVSLLLIVCTSKMDCISIKDKDLNRID